MYDITDLYLPARDRDVTLTELRAAGPVHRDDDNDLWYVVRHAEITEISRTPDLFSSAQGISYFDALPLGMVTMDDPDHGRLRRIVSKAFSPRVVTDLRDRTVTYVKERTEAVLADGGCDFVDAIAAPVTLRVIADILGIPPDELDDVRDWADRMMDAGGRLDEAGVAEDAAGAFLAWTQYVSEHIQRRMSTPGDDVLSALAHADDEALDLDELAMFATLLMVAGNETTRHTTTRSLEALIEHPDAIEQYARDAEHAAVATEELLRWTSVVRGMMRTVTMDTVIAETGLSAGDRVYLVYPSANRDELVFDDPSALELGREPNQHLAFGIGTHYCLGAGLARMEIEAILRTFLTIVPLDSIAIAAEPVPRSNALVAGVESMPVAW